MPIIVPNSEQLSQCLSIEKAYRFEDEEWEKQGFFLPGATEELYYKIASNGYARCLTDETGNILSFILALLPTDPLIENLLFNQSSTIITDSHIKIDLTKSIWVAKIATEKSHHRAGYAQQLYLQLFEDYKDCSFFTATALSPKRNSVSEQFQKHMNFTPCGIFLGRMTEEISNPVSLIWYRQ